VKRPPDKKLMLAATLLLVAAGLAQPAVGTHPASTFAIAKLLGRS
jgi:hypothetical protein